MSKLEQHFTKYEVEPSQLASFIFYTGLEHSSKKWYLENPDVPTEGLEYVTHYYDREDNYLLYYIIKFEGQFYKLTLHFESYGAEFTTENTTWRDFTEVNPVSKTIIDYE